MTIQALLEAMLAKKTVTATGIKNLQGFHYNARVVGIKQRGGLIWIELMPDRGEHEVADTIIFTVQYGMAVFS